jgi:hypothetical protein
MVRQAKRRVAASTLAVAAISMSGASAALTTSLTPTSTYGTMQFNAMPITYPADNVMSSTGATINGAATTFQGFNKILRSGDVNNGFTFGQMIVRAHPGRMAVRARALSVSEHSEAAREQPQSVVPSTELRPCRPPAGQERQQAHDHQRHHDVADIHLRAWRVQVVDLPRHLGQCS